MKSYARKVITNPLFSGSAIMVLGSNIANFFSYGYHFIVGRLLSPAEYGELGALISFLGLLVTALSFLGLVIVKFVSSARDSELNGVFGWFQSIGIKFGIAVSLLVIVLSPFISSFLHIDLPEILILSPIFLVATANFVYKSFLQGQLKFHKVVISTNFEIISKLLLSVVVILLGYSVFGAISAFLFAGLLNFLLLRRYVSVFRVGKIKHVFSKHREVFVYTVPIFIASFFSYALISLDVILVKHYFPSEEAGTYTVLSTLGRIIFFAVAPISSVMFPIISKRNASGKGYRSIFKLSMIMSSVVILGILVLYKFLPFLVVGVLYGSNRYLDAYGLLPWTGLFIGFYTLASQIISYYLSLGTTKIVILVPITLFAQVIGIILYHDTLFSVILVSIVVTAAFLATALGRLVYDRQI